ncbi:glycoside hydrolase family 32 protein [Streptomyces sp.]|uniref:glycoside hydrolase family 32 protein n=1 Tax=Streptomyces sp. TaxID=1931 RepID=UPI002F401F48
MTLDQSLSGTDLAALAERDPQRPRFHFTSPGGWLNDPNGMSHWNGRHHLFYQYNPYAPVHHRIHWGHATSTDLVHWTDEPVALTPGDEGPDADGCWSGVLVDDGGVPTLVYSGRHGERELPCVATGSPDLNTWAKDPANPVIAAPPAGLDVTAFRDHCVWREGDRWRQLIGSGVRGQGGVALLYESADLREWSYVGPLLSGDASDGRPGDVLWTGTMWECVDLFRVEGTDALVFSAWDDGVTHHPLYWTGRYEGDAFTPTALHRLDYGQRYFYAPQSTRDAAGRRIMFGWLQEGRPEQACVAAGWSGVMSLPRLVTLGADGGLHQQPVPEVAALRRDHQRPDVTPAPGGTWTPVPGAGGDQFDLELTVRLEPGASLLLSVRETPDRSERTVLELTRAEDPSAPATMLLHRERSSLDPTADTEPRYGEVPLQPDGRIDLRVLADHSALETFANGRPLTSRIYPTRSDALGIAVAAGAGAHIDAFDAWRMADIWSAPRPLWP